MEHPSKVVFLRNKNECIPFNNVNALINDFLLDIIRHCFALRFNLCLVKFQIFFCFFAKIECGLYFLNRFDVLMSKMIFKK